MSIIGTFPYTITNGQYLDAIPVMSDFSYIQSQVNTNVPLATVASALSVTGPVTGTTISASGTITPSTTNGIVGTTLGDNAISGSVGEVITATSGALSIANSVAQSISSIVLTAGDWDVYGSLLATPAGSTTISVLACGINITNNVLPTAPLTTYVPLPSLAGVPVNFPVPTQRINITVPTIVYVVGYVTFSVSTCTATGYLMARRVR